MDKNRLQSLISKTALYSFLPLAVLVLTACTLIQDPSPTEIRDQAQDPTKTTTANPPAPPSPTAGSTAESLQGEDATPTTIHTPSVQPAVTPTSSVIGLATTVPQPPPIITSELDRFGVTIARFNSDAEAAHARGLPFGMTLNWNVMTEPPQVPADFWQLVRVNEEGIRKTSWDTIEEVLTTYPGSYWIVGNEPDVQWQDNVTPQRYAQVYHEVYTFIKERDPGARVVIGGVAQPTPLRRAYLDIVLETYEKMYGAPMPIDVWNVHAFILREEEDSWGVGIPPGMAGEEGILYEIEDHDDIEILAQNIRDFRVWMVERGYGGKPLVISEYGILMPEDYGFPHERVSAFMESTFDLFREMEGEDGYTQDENRLVQWWFWYSLYDDLLYSTGNLWDEESGQLTDLGQAWTTYMRENVLPADNEQS